MLSGIIHIGQIERSGEMGLRENSQRSHRLNGLVLFLLLEAEQRLHSGCVLYDQCVQGRTGPFFNNDHKALIKPGVPVNRQLNIILPLRFRFTAGLFDGLQALFPDRLAHRHQVAADLF